MVFTILGNSSVKVPLDIDTFIELKPHTKYYIGGFSQFHDFFISHNIKYKLEGELDELLPHKNFVKRDTSKKNITNSTILFTRSGGAGDLLFFSPFLKKLHDNGNRVSFSTKPQYVNILNEQPYIYGVFPIPIKYDIINTMDYWVSARGIIETFKYNVYDMLCNHLNIELSNDEKRPVFYPIDEFEKMADEYLKTLNLSGSKKNIAIQINSTADIRTWPFAIPFARILLSRGFNVFLFGSKNIISSLALIENSFYYPQTYLNDYRFSASIIKRMDMIVTPDSSLYHFAEAVGTPALVIFGPFDPENRVKYYKHTWTLSPENKYCIPCQLHHRQYCPRSNYINGLSPCLEQISVDIVYEAIKHILSI